jgi:hypothetical protein
VLLLFAGFAKQLYIERGFVASNSGVGIIALPRDGIGGSGGFD